MTKFKSDSFLEQKPTGTTADAKPSTNENYSQSNATAITDDFDLWGGGPDEDEYIDPDNSAIIVDENYGSFVEQGTQTVSPGGAVGGTLDVNRTPPTDPASGNATEYNTPEIKEKYNSGAPNEVLTFPTETTSINSPWGWRFSNTDFHHGNDNPCKCGTILRAPFTGKIGWIGGETIFADPAGAPTGGLGQYNGYGITLTNKAGWKALFIHLSARYAKSGDIVEQGQIIGRTGGARYQRSPNFNQWYIDEFYGGVKPAKADVKNGPGCGWSGGCHLHWGLMAPKPHGNPVPTSVQGKPKDFSKHVDPALYIGKKLSDGIIPDSRDFTSPPVA